MKKWQVKKVRDYLISLVAIVLGVIISIQRIVTISIENLNMWDCLVAMGFVVGPFLIILGIVRFIIVRNTNYARKYRRKVR